MGVSWRTGLRVIEGFIDVKVEKHLDPPRKGTHKGDPIGLSQKKYKAALMSLLYLFQADVADEVGVTPGLLRKWHTETEFKETIRRCCSEFADRYLGIILEEKGLGHDINEYLENNDGQGTENLDAGPDIFQVHRVNDFYGFRLREPLVHRLLKQAQEGNDIALIIGALSGIASLLSPVDKKLRVKLKLQQNDIKDQARLICIKEIRSRLLKPTFNAKDKKVALCLLKIIEEFNP